MTGKTKWIVINNPSPRPELDAGGIYEVTSESAYLYQVNTKSMPGVVLEKKHATPATSQQIQQYVGKKISAFIPPGKVYSSSVLENATKNIQMQLDKLAKEHGAISYEVSPYINSDNTVTVTFTSPGQKHVNNSTNKEEPEPDEEPLTRLELIETD